MIDLFLVVVLVLKLTVFEYMRIPFRWHMLINYCSERLACVHGDSRRYSPHKKSYK